VTAIGAIWTLIVAAVAVLATVCIGDLVSEEVRQRLDRFPHALICLATRRLPDQLRAEQRDEWTAELYEVLRGAEALPITRLLRGTCYAAGLLRTAGDIGRQLATPRLDSPVPAMPAQLTCAEVRRKDQLYAYLDGELGAEAAAGIQRHLETCGSCLREYGLEEAVKKLVHKTCGCGPVADDDRDAILRRIQQVLDDDTE
jgi:mycothiol system anti-sigma-R factor